MNDEVTYVSRETQPRSESEKMLAFFHLLTDGDYGFAIVQTCDSECRRTYLYVL